MKPCRKCGHELPNAEATCPACGSPQPVAWPGPLLVVDPGADAAERRARWFATSATVVCLGFAVGMAALGGFLGMWVAGSVGCVLGSMLFCFAGIVTCCR